MFTLQEVVINGLTWRRVMRTPTTPYARQGSPPAALSLLPAACQQEGCPASTLPQQQQQQQAPALPLPLAAATVGGGCATALAEPSSSNNSGVPHRAPPPTLSSLQEDDVRGVSASASTAVAGLGAASSAGFARASAESFGAAAAPLSSTGGSLERRAHLHNQLVDLIRGSVSCNDGSGHKEGSSKITIMPESKDAVAAWGSAEPLRGSAGDTGSGSATAALPVPQFSSVPGRLLEDHWASDDASHDSFSFMALRMSGGCGPSPPLTPHGEGRPCRPCFDSHSIWRWGGAIFEFEPFVPYLLLGVHASAAPTLSIHPLPACMHRSKARAHLQPYPATVGGARPTLFYSIRCLPATCCHIPHTPCSLYGTCACRGKAHSHLRSHPMSAGGTQHGEGQHGAAPILPRLAGES